MNLVITMDDRVSKDHAPVFPGEPSFCRWSFADPLAQGMSRAERTRLFQKVFWQSVRGGGLFPESPWSNMAAPEPVMTARPVSYGDEKVCAG
jgi:arsenate reductase